MYCIVSVSVELEGCGLSELHITGTVMASSLQLTHHDTGAVLECVWFGATYYGTDVTRCAMLLNNSPDSVVFALLLNDAACGQETVCRR